VESRFIPVASLQRGSDNPGDLVGGVSRFATNIIIRSRWQTCELVTRASGTITGNSDIVIDISVMIVGGAVGVITSIGGPVGVITSIGGPVGVITSNGGPVGVITSNYFLSFFAQRCE
jgi:hypothetical protein